MSEDQPPEPKVISLTGDPVHFTADMNPNQLFSVDGVIGGLPPAEDIESLIVVADTKDGLYIAATHSSAICSLLLGQASNFIHRACRIYLADET